MYTEWKWGESEEFDSNIMSTESCINMSSEFTHCNFIQIILLQGISIQTWSRVYKTFFMLNSTELEIYPIHKC